MFSQKNSHRKDLAKNQVNGFDQNQYYLDADPDLNKDVEIVIPRASARSRTTMSAKSQKTTHSKASENDNIVRSRGRPIKPHETEPFLSIDNLPPEKTFVSDKTAATPSLVQSRASMQKTPFQSIHQPSFHRSERSNVPRQTSPSARANPVTTCPVENTVTTTEGRTSQDQANMANKPDKNNQSDFHLDLSPLSAMSSPNDNLSQGNRDSAENSHCIVMKPEILNNFIDNADTQPLSQEVKRQKGQRPHTANAKLENGRHPTVSAKLNFIHSTSSDCLNDLSAGKTVKSSAKNVIFSNKSKYRSGTAPRPNTSPLRSRPSSRSSQMSRPNTAGSRTGSRLLGLGFRSITSRTGRVTPANTPYQSPNKQVRQANHHVRSPFKHAVDKPDLSPDGRETPSMGMKERTALAAFHVHKMLAVAGERDTHKVNGKLLKGKLKPLYPVKVDGPGITNCRGIVSEAHSYQASPSRTLQRRIQLMTSIPNVHEYLYDRPRTVESVHQTSVATSIDDNYDENIDSDRNLPDEVLYRAPTLMEPPAPENTFIPAPSHEPTYIQENISAQGKTILEETPRMFATETGKNKSDLLISSNIHHEMHISESDENIDHLPINSVADANKNNMNAGHSVGDDAEEMFQDNDRLGSQSKSVHFVEKRAKARSKEVNEESKEMKELTNASIAKQEKEGTVSDVNDDDEVARKNKKNVKESCKEDGMDTLKKKRDESDDDDNDDNQHKDDKYGGRANKQESSKASSSVSTKGTNHDSNKEEKKGGNKDAENVPRDINSQYQKTPHASINHTKKYAPDGNIKPDKKKSSRPNSANRAKLSARSKQRSSEQSSRPSSSRCLSRERDSRCSRYEKSKASKMHTNKLEVTYVIHGDKVVTSLGSESPHRGRSRSASPCRSRRSSFRVDSDVEDAGRHCVGPEDQNDNCNVTSYRSKVKFMLEGEEPEMETIFIEDDDEIGVKPDKLIDFDVLDSEIALLRSNIQNSLLKTEILEDADVKSESDQELQTEEEKESDLEGSVVMDTEAIESIRGDYSNILEKYRQKCMDHSEAYGAISERLVTPRNTQNFISSGQRSHCERSNSSHIGSSVRRRKNSYSGENSVGGVSDSGRGSVENLSEISQTASSTFTDTCIPKLDLCDATSDLDLNTDRTDVTVTNEMMEIEDDLLKKNILEIVCDQLSPLSKKQFAKDRKESEEDVSKLKVVATSKSLSKTKHGQNSHIGDPRPTFPPLCFTINARPPAGYLYYFAYGPDMNPHRLGSYIQREIDHRYWGLLFGFNLVFNKKGTSEEAGGFANLEFNPLRSVEGCIYRITPAELLRLDKCVGYPQHYAHVVLPVWLSNSADVDAVGVSQYCVPALTFIAQQHWTETERQLPCDYALSQCIKSADLVTPSYRDSLVAMAAQQPVQVAG
ncbi:uncharacterized protein LOC127837733 isoform X2 [Dreissena polymorpha]|uniref:uncharacterized protein LOC127837733 isoform X2 n=1 Tax=Dreissena polymorpha TaxID=45954 RepID=UPI0022640C4E|nr:uncharacterized protein LOC127837733 isoform X2 [Dreissena polymorpha]